MKSPEQNFFKKENNQELSPMIEELRMPFQKILGEIKDSINKGEYKTILGDDGSGRIPTIILNDIIKNIYQDKGFKNPQVLFIGLTKPYPKHNERFINSLKNYLDQHLLNKNLNNEKCLISTDFIFEGESLRPLVEILKERKISYDISVISLDHHDSMILQYLDNTWDYDRYGKEWNMSVEDQKNLLENLRLKAIKEFELGEDKQIHIGTDVISLGLWRERHDKNKEHHLSSSGIKKKWENYGENFLPEAEHKYKLALSEITHKYEILDDDETRAQKELGKQKVNQARKEAKILSDQLTDWYRKNLEK